MGEVVNLRLIRKRNARAEHDAAAAANRALHGRSKAEKAAQKSDRERDKNLLDGHRLDKPDVDGQR